MVHHSAFLHRFNLVGIMFASGSPVSAVDQLITTDSTAGDTI